MNFFKKIIGFGNEDIKKTASSSKFSGSLYRVVKDARSIMYLPIYLDLLSVLSVLSFQKQRV